MNDNKKYNVPNLWDAMKAVLIGQFIFWILR